MLTSEWTKINIGFEIDIILISKKIKNVANRHNFEFILNIVQSI